MKPEESKTCHSEAKFCTGEQQSCETGLARTLTGDCTAKPSTGSSEKNFKTERSEDVTIQTFKSDYQVNMLDSHVADAPQNDAEPHLDGKLIPSPQLLSQEARGRKAAFTLAETMIVLVILGIVAAITVPALVRHHVEAANRTRIKKAMTVYDMAVNKFIIENQLKSDTAVYQIAPKDNCTLTSQYFKVVENIEENGNKNICKFKTSDGVWWDISDILNPMIALKKVL